MTASVEQSKYKEAVQALYKYHQDQSPHVPELLEKSKRYFTRCGHELEELKKLNAIHVTGTKGKGSVSAMCESILRRYGLKTGLLTSPHLVEVRERIQINGRPLEGDQYAKYFWECLNGLESTKEDEQDMPSYYRFFTFMAFHVFLREKVDVAIIEVGKGGAYDTTNILIDPVACGITLMDMDHEDVLGDTLEKITWHKAGICKPGSPMIIFPQKPGPLRVIVERAREVGVSSLEIVPDLKGYSPGNFSIGLRGEHNKLNASLAVQLCKKWLISKGMWDGQPTLSNSDSVVGASLVHVPIAEPFELPENFLEGLKQVHWPGRCQIEKRNGVTFYIDAAHTPLSVETCSQWFKEEAEKEARDIKSKVLRVLVFNWLGRRDPYALLPSLVDSGFDYAIFAPSFTGGDGSTPLDQWNPTNELDKLRERSKGDEVVWQELHTQNIQSTPTHNGLTNGHPNGHPNGHTNGLLEEASVINKTKVFSSIDHAIEWVCRGRGVTVKSTSPEMLSEVPSTPDDLKSASHLQVLVTGSARLIGITMYVLDMSVSD